MSDSACFSAGCFQDQVMEVYGGDLTVGENKSQQSEQIKLSDQEIERALALRKNPILANDLGVIINRLDEEIAQGMDANQAELNAIESVQKNWQSDDRAMGSNYAKF